MPEPISSSAATSTLTGLALLSLFPGVDPGVLLGAFAGALVFIATTAELGNLRKAGLFIAAFVTRCTGGPAGCHRTGQRPAAKRRSAQSGRRPARLGVGRPPAAVGLAQSAGRPAQTPQRGLTC